MTVDEWLQRTQLPRFRRRLLGWYRRHGRRLPWRETSDSYAIWVSEIMLQQTQVATVLGYYDRFLRRFPTLVDLAHADEQEVLLHWQGLGYYRRCRHLHAAARAVVAQGKSQLPTQPAELLALPGFGQYCANAVATFAFNARVGILEANTIRLWSRLLADPRDPASTAARQDLWSIAERVVPRSKPGEFNQALMDLGATLCTPKSPQCGVCPLRPDCAAWAAGQPTEFPRSKQKKPLASVSHVSVIVVCRGRVLIQKRPSDAVWGGMWEFPHAEIVAGEEPFLAAERILAPWSMSLGNDPQPRLKIQHAVMRSRITLHVFQTTFHRRADRISPFVLGEASASSPSTVWVTPAELSDFPMSSPQRRIANHLHQHGLLLETRAEE